MLNTFPACQINFFFYIMETEDMNEGIDGRYVDNSKCELYVMFMGSSRISS